MRPFDPRLLRYAHSARKHIVLSAGLGLLTAILVITQALLISWSVSPIITGEATLSDVLTLIWILLAVATLRALTVTLREATSHKAADRAIRELRAAVIDRTEALGPRWRAVNGADSTTLITRGLDDLSPYFVKFLPQLFLFVTVTPLALLTILILDFWSALIAALVIPLIPIFMVLIGRFTQESSRAKLAAMERLGSQLLDLMAGLPTLRGLGREDGPKTHLKKLGHDSTRTTMSTLSVAFLSGGVLEFLSTLSVALVAVEVGMRMVSGHIPLTIGLAVIMLAPEVFEPIRQVGTQFHASANGITAAQSAFDIIETPLPGTAADSSEASETSYASTPKSGLAGSHEDQGKTPAPRIDETVIRFADVSVAARGAWAPWRLQAQIQPGSITALVGPSGAGKTTTVMTVLGVEPTTRGTIQLIKEDGSIVDLKNVDRASWWEQITWVPQSPTIVPGTLLENLNVTSLNDRLEKAAEATGFAEVVSSLKEGWYTRVGMGGVGLSVGQRQRLALTRALVADRPLVILDEPTAHLDALSEEVVLDAIRSLHAQGRTVIVIAHRQAVVALAHQRIEIVSKAASSQDLESYPQLTTQKRESNVEVTTPGLLDETQMEDAR
ncbi:thiol reductant ABC exporter subunit CydD [Schaalia vaccimaxillae]|uniref:thiol reductant ABC exporter subunit CydD n=1 Tax=Schaalia vaccimaxillae TaxID=183916 RepID=UPI0003B2F834|nr:thiol reductant ABC exporter subunit CydD [Schaalia vaccimaxillae]